MHPNDSLHQLIAARRTTNTRTGQAFRTCALLVSFGLSAVLGAIACLERPLCDVDCQPKTTNVLVASIKSQNVDKIDLLFMIDNSSSMSDKQAVLQEAVPDLVRRLVNPNCVNPDGSSTPAPEGGRCPSPQVQEFTPIRDIHVGVITSSLGAHGSTKDCVANESDDTQMKNDHAWLVGTRSRFHVPAGGDPVDPVKGFLDWNPGTHPNQSVNAFNTTFKEMTVASGSEGCGFESQLESIYRFLVDPHPPAGIVIGKCPGTDVECASRDPRDDGTLLAQRAAFLRPDSLVAIIMLTDENDCSIDESSPQGYYASSQNKAVPRASSACAQNPNDPCCYSCGGPPPKNCVEDPVCKSTDRLDDPPNLRCFHQVQRFGHDFLYPTQRYVNAFREPRICMSRADLANDAEHCPDRDGDRAPDMVENPLMKGIGAVSRSDSLVFLAGIIGVPWQDIATGTKPDGKPYPVASELHYQTAEQMKTSKTWDVILGNSNPGNNQAPILPTDALMQESVNARGGNDGQNPPQPLAGTAAGYLANRVNGHEWAVPDHDDLQYACIFPLIKPRSCTGDLATAPGCDCKQTDLAKGSNNPLCQNEGGNYTTDQIFGKAYPGLRELQVLKDYGKNSIVASICARKLKDNERDAQDWGYRPAVDAIVDRLKGALTGSCLPRELRPDQTGKIPCSVVEVRPVPSSGRPPCEATAGRREAESAVVTTTIDKMRRSQDCDAPNKPACSQFYVCEIVEAGKECHTGEVPPSPGWCYIDPAIQPNDNPKLVETCSATERRSINFVDPDHRTPASDAVALVACFGSQIQDEETPSATPLQSAGMP
jgi:hypothetical protein